MSLRACRMGCNVIAYERLSKKYAMTCAWMTMIEGDVVGMLIGSQSETGKNLNLGDEVGVSALAVGQKDIAIKLGESHSSELEKFEGVEFEREGTAMFVKDAKVKMLCEVVKIVTLTDPDDRFVVLKVLNHTSKKDVEFLPLDDVYPEE